MARIADLYGSASDLLSAFQTNLEANGVTIPAVKGSPVVYAAPGAPGLIAWDQPGLFITLDSLVSGTPGNPQPGAVNVYARNWTATFTVLLLRSVSGLNDSTILPTMGDISDDASVTMPDAAALILAATAIELDPPGDLAQAHMVIGPCEAVGPAGGIAGNSIQIQTQAN